MPLNPALVEVTAIHPVTYRLTSACKFNSKVHRNLSVNCSREDLQHRRMSWNGIAGTKDRDDVNEYPQRPHTNRSALPITSPTRVRLIYEDEDAKARVCGNVYRLLNVVQKDPEAKSANARLARKVLKYRRVMGRLGDVNIEDPNFDASAFFGIEWCRVGPSSN
ncbi:uncharacterized protein PHALS_01157 [Plasmopara halstedii]|uniref:Uncharacterized protein n=1 Tax=Plasmopara halstedii TaxID=4781 RepID=A0A0P1ATY3_PLAHL|nr:uncharacterized protein PHALS_01157 [Plasmopara halstedii]CEG44823.1 hypothetical protein PHALS_01157 [Plasmopara halstedii]|eukprot:XP_024581192.1 hypothetical protein PHALS_01157 [Plasmopara halstedii]